MAVAIASTSTYSQDNRTTMPITAPASIATGDLLVLIAATGGGATVVTPPAGWTEYTSLLSPQSGSIPSMTAKIFYKYAVLADETESTYTVTCTTGTCIGATIYRITGNQTSGVPFLHFENAVTSVVADGSYSETSLTLARTAPSHVMILFGFGSNVDATFNLSSSNYSVTSSDSNPTWTEIIDATNVFSSGSRGGWTASAHATSTNTSSITALGFDYTGSTSDATVVFGFLYISEPVDETGTNALHEASPALFTNAGVEVGGTGTIEVMEASPEFFTQSGRATSPTQWTNEAKPSTNWVNEQK